MATWDETTITYFSNCERCDHIWKRRKAELPKVCPRCKSPYWNTPKAKKDPGYQSSYELIQTINMLASSPALSSDMQKRLDEARAELGARLNRPRKGASE